MDVIKRSGLLISKEYYNTIPYVKIKEHLGRRVKEYNTSNYSVQLFYIESEKFLLIPRNFPIQKYFTSVNVIDKTTEGEIIDIEHNIVPRDNVQKRAINHLMKNESCIIQLSPGIGKTVISIYMIAERKRKTLITVHRDSLVDQWTDRIESFTNLKRDQIANLKSNTFVDDLKKPIIVSTVQTILSLLKRKRQEFLISLNGANVGVFIGDEVHTTVGAPTFSECSIQIPAKYTYGLSATPYRYDANTDIIKYHLGDVYSDDDDSGTMKCNVTVVLVDYKIDSGGTSKYIRWGGMFQRARYLNQIKKSTPCVEAIKGFMSALIKDRKIIFIAERIKFIDEIYAWTPHESKSKFCGSAKMDTLEKDVTFATPGKCRDGVDAPWKDCLVMTSPVTNIEQLAGRVTRFNDNKKTPAIIDMVDYGCKDISNTFYKRRKYYLDRGWNIQYVMYVNKNINVVDEEVAMAILEG